jgi:hypothetical protein
MERIIENARNLQGNIANDVWPDGWTGKCHKCGKPFHYTKAECAYYLGHGWPKCDHNYTEPEDAARNGAGGG